MVLATTHTLASFSGECPHFTQETAKRSSDKWPTQGWEVVEQVFRLESVLLLVPVGSFHILYSLTMSQIHNITLRLNNPKTHNSKRGLATWGIYSYASTRENGCTRHFWTWFLKLLLEQCSTFSWLILCFYTKHNCSRFFLHGLESSKSCGLGDSTVR